MAAKIKDTKGTLSSRLIILIFVILTAGILFAGHFFYSNYANNHRTQIEQHLSAIADLKSGELVQWRKERIGDANQLFGNPAFSSLVQRYFEHPDDVGAQQQLRSWLTAFQANYQYERVFLLDTRGIRRISAPDTAEPVPRHILPAAQEVLQAGKVTVLDLDRDEDTPQPHMVVLVPVFSEKDGNQPLGVVVMRVDPYQYLYPLINSWPTPSKTAETMLIRRDGNDALFLNELKFQKDTALKLRIPLEQKDVPAVKAALGEQGIVEGRDYRGEQVIADIRQIPDSPWFMVARIDAAEVYAPLTQMLWVVIALVSALLLGAGAAVGLIWRQQNIRVYKERAESAEALSESEARYRDLFENASLAISISTLDRKLLYINPKFASMFGYQSPEEVMATVQDTAVDLFADPQHREEIVRLKQANPGLNTFEILYRRKDGSTFWGNLTVRMIIDSDGSSLFESFIQDITVRKHAEEALRESEELFRVSQEMSPDGFTILHPLRNEKGEIIDFTWVYENKTIARINGTDPEEVKGKRMLDLFPTHKGTSIFEAYIYVSNSGKPQIIEEVYVGEIVSRPTWLRLVVVSMGEDIAILAQDITERKLAEEKLAKSYESLQKALNDAINTMVKIVELRDPYTAGHQQKVADLATAIAVEMKFDDTQIEQLRMAALIHDIGKMYVPSDILSKPGKLSAIELGLIKTHSQSGYDIVKSMDFPGAIAETILQHHERLDGSGYPNGLKAEDTLMKAKILAVADVVEAMASHRPYRPALGIDKALEEISKNKGKLYDPGVVDTCLKLFNSGKFEFKSV
jgi:PAS domain S-box-containing protein/putative nucleotidyltransferase with HDIG domain